MLSLLQEHFLLELQVKDGIESDRCCGIENVVELIEHGLVEEQPREYWHKAIPKQRRYKDDIFIEHVRYQVRVLAVSLTTVDEQKSLKEFELTNSIVTWSCSLLTFQTTYSNTHMSCCNHVDIISAITYCKSCSIWLISPNHSNDLSLLLWRYSTSKNYFSRLRKLKKLLLDSLVFSDLDESLTTHNHSILSDQFSKLLVSSMLRNLKHDVLSR